jgi:hypothetical protein
MTRTNLAAEFQALRAEVAQLRDQLARATEVERIMRRADLPESLPGLRPRRPRHLRIITGARP